ncbi:MAG: UvrD-helicase domain-containing protein [Firmicutes bacterium]|nr:UvrD-helicase domain-containing protein [Bacillota bacterium]
MNLEHLNKEQREAVQYTEGPLLILAGAGSGKTQTMTHRIAYLIEQGVSPYNILAVTFTNKAAREMRDRIEKLVGVCPGMWIMTFHAMSLRMLREHPENIGYTKSFVVYDTVDQKTVLKAIYKERNIDSKDYPYPVMANIISKCKERDWSPEKFREMEMDTHTNRVYYQVFKDYEKELKKNNAMDFDDLLLNAYHLLKDNPVILESYRRRFRYVMVDEYQDTNHIQYQLVKMLSSTHRNICVVGDDDQCIYQWRGADIRNILDFEKDFKGTKVIKLEQNYRSFKNILACANSVIKNNRNRKVKKLWTEREKGDLVIYNRVNSDKEEAAYVAREVYFLRELGRSYDDFAILYRTNAQSRLFEDAFKKARIPYQILSGFSFYERKETKDMISYMRLVVNPKDDVALERIINEPKRGIGPTTFGKYKSLAMVKGMSIFECLLEDDTLDSFTSKARESLRSMLNVIRECIEEKDNLRVSDIYDNLLVKTGYLPALEAQNTQEAESRIENLMDFKSFIYDFEKEKEDASEEATLDEFLERVSTQSDTDKYDEADGKVTMMTMHSAKGLEFPVVFMPGMEDGLFPSFRSMDSAEGIEEERRLCYVGMTRAREKLILTSAQYRVSYGHGDFTRESMFISEIDPKLLDVIGDTYRPTRKIDDRLKMGNASLDGFAKPAAAPFDALKYARQQVKKTNSSEEFSVGDQVTHGKFGHGIVIESTKTTVTVNFDEAGVKKLAIGFAPLKKI